MRAGFTCGSGGRRFTVAALGRSMCTRLGRALITFGCGALIAAMAAAPCVGALGKKAPTKEQEKWWGKLSGEVKQAELERHVNRLSSFQPRLAGYPGANQAASYIVSELKRLGFRDIRKANPDPDLPDLPYREAYWVTVPVVDGKSTIEVVSGDGAGGEVYEIYPLWPNLVRTSQLPEEGQEYQLIYGADGKLAAFNGKDIKGTAVLMDFNCGSDWLNAPRLGARAVIFVEPDSTSRGEAEAKFLRIPINIPRFWIPRSSAYELMARLKAQPDVKVRIKCRMDWKRLPAYAYYDSMSIVPQLSPGAESTAGAAALLELCRILSQPENRPKRTVRVIFNGAHFLGLSGMRNWVANHLDDLIEGKPVKKDAKFLGLIPYRKTVREKLNINLFLALDLSTQSKRVGVFYKGMYYDQREDMDISRKFSDFARTLRENAALMADWGTTAGFADAEGQFADGVNPIYGKPWRTFIFGKIALDNEPITLGGGRGAARRQLPESPLSDTVFGGISVGHPQRPQDAGGQEPQFRPHEPLGRIRGCLREGGGLQPQAQHRRRRGGAGDDGGRQDVRLHSDGDAW